MAVMHSGTNPDTFIWEEPTSQQAEKNATRNSRAYLCHSVVGIPTTPFRLSHLMQCFSFTILLMHTPSYAFMY
jgi:hypothetical protein